MRIGYNFGGANARPGWKAKVSDLPSRSWTVVDMESVLQRFVRKKTPAKK
jgi:hypothetical protein